jgi:dTDP-4-dehydrorhamnose 3,5-epimerase
MISSVRLYPLECGGRQGTSREGVSWMRFTELTELQGAWLVDPMPARDERGSFSRLFCAREFADRGLETHFVQYSISHSQVLGTLRGLHFQQEPHSEVKLVCCQKGAIADVIVDLREDSPTFGRWHAFELSAENRRLLYVPKGFAHGFQSLRDDVEVSYMISTFYTPEAACGIRYDDPAFAITWPLPPAALSERDRAWPDFVIPRGKRRFS